MVDRFNIDNLDFIKRRVKPTRKMTRCPRGNSLWRRRFIPWRRIADWRLR
jgi:hypothetical protein